MSAYYCHDFTREPQKVEEFGFISEQHVERIDWPAKTLSEPKMSAKLVNKVQRNSFFLAGFSCQDSF